MELIEFYRCPNCDNVVTRLSSACGRMICCGSQMVKLEPKTADLGQEKHTPVLTHKDGVLTAVCGSVPHPMEPKHYIEWMALQTEGRLEIVYLKPGEKAEASWPDVAHGAVFAYCNLHGLWVTTF